MSSRTRTQATKMPAGATIVRIPRQRGHRSQPLVVVIPEHPSLGRELLGLLGSALWHFRRPLAPTGLAVLAFGGTALLHALVWWSGLALAATTVGPLVWLAALQWHRPAADRAVWGRRIALALLGTIALVWTALAAAFGPLAGPLELCWLLALIGAQTVWLIVRRMP